MDVRKMMTYIDEAYSEAGQPSAIPLRKVAVVAIVRNPFSNSEYAHDLSALVDASVAVGQHMSEIAVQSMGPYQVESYGKAAVVGFNGEQEHAVAMITTAFGNVLREAVGGGKAWISSITKRAGPGVVIDIPLANKDALYVRSHYDGMTLLLPDAPLADEIAVICCLSNGGRLNARVGGLHKEYIKGIDGLV